MSLGPRNSTFSRPTSDLEYRKVVEDDLQVEAALLPALPRLSPFSFVDGYFTAFWRNGLDLQVDGVAHS